MIVMPSTYTGLELRQQVLADAVIVALLAKGVRQVVNVVSLCLRQRQLRRAQLLAGCGRRVAVQRAFATDFCHGEWRCAGRRGCANHWMRVLEVAAECWTT